MRQLRVGQLNPETGNENRFPKVGGSDVSYQFVDTLDQTGPNEVTAADLAKIQPSVNGFQQSVLDIQSDSTLDPGVSPTTGDRYIITDAGDLNVNFGSISGLANNDIVEYDGAAFTIVYNAASFTSGLAWVDSLSQYYNYTGVQWQLLSFSNPTFEEISQNLMAYPYTLNYTGDLVTSVVYDLGSSLTVTKTINYTGEQVTSVVLSGDLPSGLTETTKTINYTGDNVSSVTYS